MRSIFDQTWWARWTFCRRRAGRLGLSGSVCLLSIAGALWLELASIGCGSSSHADAKAGSITFTSASGTTGTIQVLAVSSTVKMSMMPTGDNINAGVDWVVSCGGNPVTGSITNGACGTLAPAHTPDASPTLYTAPSVVPIGTAVTVTATVTSNPSQSASASFTILASPIGVSFQTAVPTSVQINTSVPLSAQITNDPLNAGVIWTATCGGGACGSFNPVASGAASQFATTYTAPAAVPGGGTVTISATSLTDTTKSASATVAVTTPPAPPSVTVNVLPANMYVQTVGPAHTTRLVALVGNDSSQAGVDWSLSCGTTLCGAITAHTDSGAPTVFVAPSTVPPGGLVTITAKSKANPAISATATANIVTTVPIVVTIASPLPPSLTTGSQTPLSANTAHDSGNLGVDWTASCGTAGACGSFNLSPAHTSSGGQITYTAPASVPTGGLVTITASSSATTPSNPGIAVTTIVALPPSVSFQQTPPAAMTSVTQAPVSALVANDVPPGGVAWSVQCSSIVAGGCGWIGPLETASGATATYTAPPVTTTGMTVTITATSVADPSVSVVSSPITINPSTTLLVNFIPSLPAQMQPNATVNLTAAVANDSSNAGVDWQVCDSGCGFFTIKPAIPGIPATPTTPFVPPVPAVTATSVSGWSNGLPIPYTAPSQLPSTGSVAVVAKARANTTAANSGTILISNSLGGPALSGVVQAASQPVVGASVSLFAAGTSGYASASSPVATAATDQNGNFTVAAGYTCPSPMSQMYVVATGGTVGTSAANPNLALMTALGACSNLPSTPVVVNEITTVASAFATSPFSGNDALTGNTSYLYLGAGSGNGSGLANAFSAVNNLVDITTGKARFTVPPGNAAAPYVEISTLADMLNACAVTSGGVEGDGSPCGALFNATDVLPQHQLYNSIAPNDTLQAAFNIAQHPVGNFGYQLNIPALGQPASLVAASAPFQPILTATPNDWSISLNYTSGGGLSTASTVASFAIDAGGNLWITDTAAGSVIEWNSTGAAISPSTGYTAGGGPIAIDATGDVWISGNGVLTELTSLGTAVQGSPFGGVVGGGTDLAIDAQSNLWIANGGGVSEFSNLGAALSPAGGYTNSDLSDVSAVGIDSSNNVWVGLSNSTSALNFAELSNPGGQLIVDGGSSAIGNVFPQISADGSGDMWAVGQQQVCKILPYAGKGSNFSASLSCQVGQSLAGQQGALPFFNAQGIALDGAGTVWVASAGGGNVPIAPSVLPIVGGNAQNYLASPSLAAGPLRVAIDGSGNLWVLLANNTITEYIGAATPTITPVALGLKNKKLGAKP